MKKVLISLLLLLLLNGCAESIALLGTSASNGRIVQSSLNSAISYGLKTQTGKTPLEHAIAYAEKKNPGKKKDTCISSIEKTRSEFCAVAKKQISLTTIALKEKTSKIIKNNRKEITTSLLTAAKETSLIENIAKKSVIYNRR